MNATAPLRLVRPAGGRVAAAVPLLGPARPAPATDRCVVAITSISDRDAVDVATWIAEHLPSKASPLRIATISAVERNWIALEALGCDHRPVDWASVISALRAIASVPLTSLDLDPSA